jgi:hypothetical protein
LEAEIEGILRKYPALVIQKEKTLGPDGLKETHVIVNEKGDRINPNVKVGPERHHAELFTWYERAFGRGMAGSLLHFPPSAFTKLRKRIGPRYVMEYHQISALAAPVMAAGSKKETERMIAAIKEFVLKYPGLYKE